MLEKGHVTQMTGCMNTEISFTMVEVMCPITRDMLDRQCCCHMYVNMFSVLPGLAVAHPVRQKCHYAGSNHLPE